MITLETKTKVETKTLEIASVPGTLQWDEWTDRFKFKPTVSDDDNVPGWLAKRLVNDRTVTEAALLVGSYKDVERLDHLAERALKRRSAPIQVVGVYHDQHHKVAAIEISNEIKAELMEEERIDIARRNAEYQARKEAEAAKPKGFLRSVFGL